MTTQEALQPSHTAHTAEPIRAVVSWDEAGDAWTVLLTCDQRECVRMAAVLGVRVGIRENRPALRGVHDARLLAKLLHRRV